ncbi:MAG TPA: leucyl aminopeptidase [Desulfobacterales bacterium]|nr:leucyl aminopeptidase [Desulfobacterales bacterium]HIP39769.1 leucyl aminopeptidase [Desulfocapsa sulfexigens]
MTATKLTLRRKKPESFKGDLLVSCLDQDENGKVKIRKNIAVKELKNAIALGDFQGKLNDSLLLYPTAPGKQKPSACRMLVIGFGKSHDKSLIELREKCRITGGTIAVKAAELKAERICLCLPPLNNMKGDEVVECVLEGMLLGDYRFLKYKKADRKNPAFTGIKEIVIYAPGGFKAMRHSMDKAGHVATAAKEARDMANEPGNGWTPESFAKYGRKLARRYKMRCIILGKNDLKRAKMGGILAVNKGSSEPPRMVILEHHTTRKNAETILIIGKGLTFDSGGVSLKPSAGMEDMKYDMCGGAAVLSTMRVVGEEKPDVNVVAIVPSTDNMGGSSALKPGDVIRHYGGITSEIVNTDAEGRLILADALAYGIKKFKPTCVIDLATLTGAVITGLGHHRTGLLSNSQLLVERLLAAGENSGEPLWQLPLDEEYIKQIDSDVADIKNTGGKSAGTITAAAYLQKFVGDTPWSHMDIAGTAWGFTKKSYIPSGPSGTGVRTLVDMIRNWEKFS